MTDEQTQPGIPEARTAASDLFRVILSTLERNEQTIDRLDRNVGRLSERMDDLSEATNHRLDDFRSDMDERRAQAAQAILAYQATMRAALEAKADKKDLVLNFATNRTVRIVTALIVCALTPVIVDHWTSWVEQARLFF